MKTKILRSTVVSVFVLVGLATLLTAGTRVALRANIITVINTNDSGPGSLRQALLDANDGDTINFDSSLNGQTITLTSGQLNVDKDVTISGPGADHLAVDGNAQSRVFYVNPGKTVFVSGLMITNGSSGIYNDGSALTLSDCTVSGNSGAGIYNNAAGFAANATLTVSNCTINGNSGGGIFTGANSDARATLTVTNSTISGNSGSGIASAAAGGQGFGNSIVTVSNSTISGNSTTGNGGGIYNLGGFHGAAWLSVNNSTLNGNSATGNGGGIYNTHQGGLGIARLELGSTVLNSGSSGENIFNVGGTVTSRGYNLSSDNGGGYLTGPGDQINTDPMLGLLQDNGGPTFTHALLLGSPAINTGDPSFTPPPDYDQRGPGFSRVVNNRIDIGSFEVQGPTPTPTATPTATPTPRTSPTPKPRPTPAPRM